MTDCDRPHLTPPGGAVPGGAVPGGAVPGGAVRVLLLSCCAPCSGDIMETLSASSIDYTVFFYNPNIHPEDEYRRRKAEHIRYAERHGVPFVDADYDPETWFALTKGLEHEPERGRRCTLCFELRLRRAARYAHDHGFPVLTSSLGISRWKNMAQVNACGHRAVADIPDLTYWDYNWRKAGGADRMIEVSRREGFYRQDYCGCVYSLRDRARSRRAPSPCKQADSSPDISGAEPTSDPVG